MPYSEMPKINGLNNQYLCLEQLNERGFGDTFIAQDSNGKKYIIKKLLSRRYIDSSQIESIKKLFREEAEKLQHLSQHRQIPELIEFFEFPSPEDNSFYLVQEYIEGKNLQEELDDKGKFDEVQVIEVLQNILSVLKFVHENGSIHRHIKPSNIIRGDDKQLYLTDFGTVKQVTTGLPTNQSITFFSDDFASPEQKAGKELFPHSDLYSLAVTCICLLTGKKATELYDTENKSWNWKNYALTNNHHLAGILDKMLMDEPNQRFQSADEVLTEFQSRPSITIISPPPLPPKKDSEEEDSITELLELLYKAAFTGFQGGLLLIAIVSLLGISLYSLVSTGIGMLVVGILVFMQYQEKITKKNRLIIALFTLTVILIVPALHTTMPIQSNLPNGLYVFLLAILSGFIGVVFIALYRLVLNILEVFS